MKFSLKIGFIPKKRFNKIQFVKLISILKNVLTDALNFLDSLKLKSESRGENETHTRAETGRDYRL